MCVVACGGSPDPDRSAEARAACEAEVAKRLEGGAAGARFTATVQSFGSGGWTVQGTVATATSFPAPFMCGVYADGDRATGRLREDGVQVRR